MNFRRKMFLFSSPIFGTMLFFPILAACSQAQQDQVINDLALTAQAIGSKTVLNYEDQKFKNALVEDAKQKSNTSSTLVYYISNKGVFHRFGTVSHILNVLQYNPNRQILIFSCEKINLKFDPLKKFANVKVYENSMKNYDWITNSIPEIFLNEISKLTDFDFYCDDFFILNNLKTLIEQKNTLNWNNISKLLNYQLNFLYKAKSINMFADGTHSADFFDNLFYQTQLLLNNVLINDQYVNAQNKYTFFKNIYTNNQTFTFSKLSDILYYFFSLVTTNEKNNNFEKTKYFMPSNQMITELNLNDTVKLNANDANNDFFDLYNSLNAGLISSIKNLSSENLKLLYAIFDKPDFNVEQYKTKMENYTNYIYSGRKLEDEEIVKKEAEKIIFLYEKIVNDGKNQASSSSNKIKIFFKGHPRDNDQVLDRLKNKIKEIKSDLKPEDWLDELDKKIPFELYILSGLFDETETKKVKIFGTYSTIALFYYDYDQAKAISNFLLSEKENSDINKIFGENSKIFSKSKRVIF